MKLKRRSLLSGLLGLLAVARSGITLRQEEERRDSTPSLPHWSNDTGTHGERMTAWREAQQLAYDDEWKARHQAWLDRARKIGRISEPEEAKIYPDRKPVRLML